MRNKAISFIIVATLFFTGCSVSSNTVETTSTSVSEHQHETEGSTVTEEIIEGESSVVSEVVVNKTGYVLPKVLQTISKEEESSCNTEILKYQDRDLNGKVYPYSYYMYEANSKEREAYVLIYNALYGFAESVDLSKLKLTGTTIGDMITYMLFDNPDFWYVSTEFSLTIPDDTVTLLNLNYSYTEEQVKAETDKLSALINMLKSDVSKDISTYDLYVYLHDFIIINAVYNDEYNGKHDSDMLGILVEKIGTCQGFAKAYQYLCREFDLTTAITIGSVGANHMWNKVPYADGWFIVDVGMDNVDSELAHDWVTHSHFGMSDKYASDKANHVEDTALYKPPVANVDRRYVLNQGEEYIIKEVKSDEIYDDLADLIIVALNNNRHYIEIVAPDEDLYKELQETVLNSYNIEFYSVLEKVNNNSDFVINTENCGLLFYNWSKTIIIYVFEDIVA